MPEIDAELYPKGVRLCSVGQAINISPLRGEVWRDTDNDDDANGEDALEYTGHFVWLL
jgi:hypothetical protein